MEENKFNLGDKVKCMVTGYQGIATARVVYLNGCTQYGVTTNELKDGEPLSATFIDEGQLELVTAGVVKPLLGEFSAPGGPQDSPKG